MRRTRRAPHKPIVWTSLKKSNTGSNKNKLFAVKHWDHDSPTRAPKYAASLEYLDKEYSIHDSTKLKDLIIKDDEEDTFIVAKISRKRALFRIGVGNSKKLSQIRSHLAQLPLVKNSVHRGQENGGSNTRYQYLGWRKHPLEAGRIGTYAFKSNAPPNIVETINAQIEVVVQSMEKSAHHLINNMEETSRFRDVQKVLNLKSVSTA